MRRLARLEKPKLKRRGLADAAKNFANAGKNLENVKKD
jgi:hypothetical protein